MAFHLADREGKSRVRFERAFETEVIGVAAFWPVLVDEPTVDIGGVDGVALAERAVGHAGSPPVPETDAASATEKLNGLGGAGTGI